MRDAQGSAWRVKEGSTHLKRSRGDAPESLDDGPASLMPEARPTPDHVETVVRSIEEIHAAHGETAGRGQRALSRAAALVSRPAFLLATVVAILLWLGVNMVELGALDAPPFPWLQGAMTLVSLCLVILLVGAQRHENELTRKRDLLELGLAMVSEQKMGKLIQLLEELRRDMPGVHDRTDRQADEMTQTPDHRKVMDTLAESADRAQE